MAPQQADRYQSAGEFAEALERFAAPPRSRRRLWAALSAAILAGLLLASYYAARMYRGSSNGDVTVASNGAKPLRIESVQIDQILRAAADRHERHGAVLADRYRLQEGDAVQFRAKLSGSAYCYWIAFRPDGREELCFPADAERPPQATDTPSYPPRNETKLAQEEIYSLTDGVGLQAFALIVSEAPLPPYVEWRRELGESPWRAFGLPKQLHIAHHNGEWEETFPIAGTVTTRGKGDRLQGGASELSRLATWLRGDRSLLVDVWLIPVLPRAER
jgi:hypothetical protein